MSDVAAGVTMVDAAARLEQATYLVESFDQRGGETRYDTVLLLPATNRTMEHRLRAVTIVREGTVSSVVELLTPERGWTAFDAMSAGEKAHLLEEYGAATSPQRRSLLIEAQRHQLLLATAVLS
ncbi:hypothetical protein [Curtobacterium sp. MCSS17_016]|uniref:hypothetical protein n=1 Tax=Curtobacterium sp. MCSS17_016 TaxID=2175644 RepID=UPI0024E032C1|nr:hypothetical protein [Curtobacterium sp. MCSS17_016]WIE81193.1 hypothetical protein DEJ19_018340 [Curtobacterium sp. MCSS17_016]